MDTNIIIGVTTIIIAVLGTVFVILQYRATVVPQIQLVVHKDSLVAEIRNVGQRTVKDISFKTAIEYCALDAKTRPGRIITLDQHPHIVSLLPGEKISVTIEPIVLSLQKTYGYTHVECILEYRSMRGRKYLMKVSGQRELNIFKRTGRESRYGKVETFKMEQ